MGAAKDIQTEEEISQRKIRTIKRRAPASKGAGAEKEE